MSKPVRYTSRVDWPHAEPDLPGWAITVICFATAFLFIVVMPWIAGMWVR